MDLLSAEDLKERFLDVKTEERRVDAPAACSMTHAETLNVSWHATCNAKA
jgi:hypothetical protein